MDLFRKFKKRAEGFVAQVNPADGGKTYSSVMNIPTVAAPPPAAPRPAPAPTPAPGTAPRPRSTASKVFDQVNPFDSGRTFKNSTPKTPTSVLHQATHNGVTNAVGNIVVKPVTNTVSGTIVEPARSIVADVTGNNAAMRAAEKRKYEALDNSLPGMTIHEAVNVAKVVKNTPAAVTANVRGFQGKAPTEQQAKALDEGLEAFNQTSLGQALGPVQDAIDRFIPTAAEASKNAGYDPNRTAAQKYVQDTVMGGVGVVGMATGVKTGAKAGAPVVKKAAGATVEMARKADEAAFTPRTRVNTQDQDALRAMSDHLAGVSNETGADLSRTITDARDAASRHGVDITQGPRATQLEAVNSILDQLGKPNPRISQGGYIRLPKDHSPDLNPEQVDHIRNYADMLKSTDGAATGGQRVSDGNGGYVRTSEHSPFYRRYFAENGRKPNDQAYFEEARREIESGRAAYGASDEYAHMSVSPERVLPAAKPKPAVTNVDMLKATATEPTDSWARDIARKTLARQGINWEPPVRHIIEDPTSASHALQSVGFDRLIQESLGRAGATLSQVVEEHAARAGIDQKSSLTDVWRVAEQSGYDVRSGVPLRRAADQTPITNLERGADTQKAQIDTINQATEELRLKATKGLSGVQHAVKIKESPFQQVWMYTDNEGQLSTFITQKRADGKWQEILHSKAPIKSSRDTKEALQLYDDAAIQEEILRANQDGVTRQYIWAENPDTGTTGLKTDGRADPVTPKTMGYDPKKHTVEGGFVRDRETGEILGNYVAVGPNGIQVQVGRQFINLDIEPSKINDGTGGIKNVGKSKGGNNQFNQAERWVEAVAKDEKTREQLRNLIIHPTREAEANMKIEAKALGEGIQSWRKALNGTVSHGERKQMLQDAVYVLEPDAKLARELGPDGAKAAALEAFEQAHGSKAASVLVDYEQWMRAAYDNMLERMNTVRRHNGLDEIERRDNYLTHIQELNKGIAQVYQDMKDGIFGEISGQSNRGKLPAQIAGRTEEFKPIQKYNPFAKHRTGDDKPTNPFDPLATYGAVTLHNIHLTGPAARVRSLETALRAAQEFSNEHVEGLTGPARDARDGLVKRFGGDYGDAVEWLTEHANLLSGKSSGWNRVMLRSAGGRKTLETLKFLQRQTGRANVLGNASSVVAQSLNFPSTLGTNGIKATTTGIARAMGDPRANAAWRKSSFMKERYTDASALSNRNALEKALRPFGVPLGLVERAFVQIAWNASYERVLASGLKGDAAIRAADSRTSKVVAGRSIGDTAHIYQNTVANVPLQFTREVTESWKNYTKDMSPYGKALALVSAMAMNYVVEEITGRGPLPDPLGASVETVMDFSGVNDDDRDPEDNSMAAKTVRAAQRGAEVVGNTVPLVSSVANQFPQDIRRSIFGEDSNLGRYDGTFALLGPAANIIRAGRDLAKGELEQAGQEVVSALPVGGQIRKTWQGIDAMANGETTDSGGSTQAVIDNSNPLEWARAAIFGKNAIPEVKSYNETGNVSYAPGSTSESINDYSKRSEQLAKEFKRRFSREDNIIRSLSEDERNALIRSGSLTQEKVDGLSRYELDVRRQLRMPAADKGQTTPEIPDGTSDDVVDFYKERAFVYDEDIDKWRKQAASGTAATLAERANRFRPKGMPELPPTNEVAEMYADFSTKRAKESWGKAKENSEKIKFLTKAYKTHLDKQQQEWYGLSANSLRSAITSGEIPKSEMDQLIHFDDTLRSLGFAGEIGNAVRRDYGYQTWSTSSSGGGRGRGGRKRVTPSLTPAYFSTTSKNMSQIRKLLASAK